MNKRFTNWKLKPGATRTRILFFLFVAFFPAAILLKGYVPGGGFTRLIHFDRDYPHRLLPEVQALPDECKVENGYDGQFYAQIALVPDLNKDVLDQVIDTPSYRSRRIGMPALANLLSFGNEMWVLYAYAVLPFVFWLMLAFYLFRSPMISSWQGSFVCMAILCSSGTLISMARALPDLPALVLTYWAALGASGGIMGVFLLALAILFKETSLLSIPAIFSISGLTHFSSFMKILIKGLMAVLPFAFWWMYVYSIFGWGQSIGTGNFSIPGAELYLAVVRNMIFLINLDQWLPLEAIPHSFALVSLILQAIYLITRINVKSPFWCMGIGFAILLPFLGRAVLEDVHAYTRVMLPLTLAFNVLLAENRTQMSARSFVFWFTAGNIGLTGAVIQVTAALF
jgi:hypothetical protein